MQCRNYSLPTAMWENATCVAQAWRVLHNFNKLDDSSWNETDENFSLIKSKLIIKPYCKQIKKNTVSNHLWKLRRKKVFFESTAFNKNTKYGVLEV